MCYVANHYFLLLEIMEDREYYCRNSSGSSKFSHTGNCCRHEKRFCKFRLDILYGDTGDISIESSEVNETISNIISSGGALICSNSWCNKSFIKSSNMTRHLKFCRKPSDMEKQCFLCKKSFTRKTHLRRHMEIHAKAKLFCMKCKKR